MFLFLSWRFEAKCLAGWLQTPDFGEELLKLLPPGSACATMLSFEFEPCPWWQLDWRPHVSAMMEYS